MTSGAERAAGAGVRAHERERACATSRGRIATRAARAHRGAGAAAPALRRRDDLPEAAAGRPSWSITSASIGCTRRRGCRCGGASARRCRWAIGSRCCGRRAANEVWSTDFVFDRTAEGRVHEVSDDRRRRDARGGGDRAGAGDRRAPADARPGSLWR